jgi:hypothetical protein
MSFEKKSLLRTTLLQLKLISLTQDITDFSDQAL